MAIDSQVAFTNTDGTAFPNNAAVNASGPTTTDGTEFVKLMIDNYMFGPQQALLDRAGIIPSGVAEAAGSGNSQEIEAMQKSFGYPGESVNWYGPQDPATLGARILLLQGQGVLRTSYSELDAAVYVGDANNASAIAFYHADDAAGTIRNIAGAYLILPDGRNIYPRFQPETNAAARIANNGSTASIISQGGRDGAGNSPIASVSRASSGTININFTAGYFTTAPVLTFVGQAAVIPFVISISNTAAQIRTVDRLGATTDSDVLVQLERQDPGRDPYGDTFIEPGIRY